MANLPKAMGTVRKARVVGGNGEAWFYIERAAIDLFVATESGQSATYHLRLSKAQLKRAIEVMESQ